MNETKIQNQAFHRAHLFLKGLVHAGVNHAVISPGSRSTPLALAAAAQSFLKKHVVLDERSAGFMALGIGKATHVPALLICTSGTAVANYHPAVIEARQSSIPLILATADRPSHLRDTGANQTIDQLKIFSNETVFFHEVAEVVNSATHFKALQRLAGRAFHYAQDRGGPVHLNFPFSKPLEPNADFFEAILQENQLDKATSKQRFYSYSDSPIRLDEKIVLMIDRAKQPLIMVGQLVPNIKPDPIFDLATTLNTPVLSEQGVANQNFAIQGFEGFLRHSKNGRILKPDLLLRFGKPPASKSLLQAIEQWQPDHHIHFNTSGTTSDVAETTTHWVKWNGGAFNTDSFSSKPAQWLKKWKAAQKNHFTQTTDLLKAEPALSDGHVYHHLVPTIPDSWSVFISNSFAARDRSLFAHWGKQQIFTNRGASGIDGITSSAIGVNIGLEQAGVLFTGDLAFLHDSNALLSNTEIKHPLIIVVLNNSGGSIFRMLPVAKHDTHFKTYFETPQQADISTLAKGYGVTCTVVNTVQELQNINIEQLAQKSPTQLQIIECQTDADVSMKIRKQLWETEL